MIRKSQQAVAFRPDGGGWAIRGSTDENSSPPHVEGARRKESAQFGRCCPPPIETSSPVGLRHRPTTSEQPAQPAQPPRRAPLVPIEHLLFRNEIRSLEKELDVARRQIVVQNSLIRGFCKLQGLREKA